MLKDILEFRLFWILTFRLTMDSDPATSENPDPDSRLFKANYELLRNPDPQPCIEGAGYCRFHEWRRLDKLCPDWSRSGSTARYTKNMVAHHITPTRVLAWLTSN